MRISDVINQFQEIQEKRGDLKVKIYNGDSQYWGDPIEPLERDDIEYKDNYVLIYHV